MSLRRQRRKRPSAMQKVRKNGLRTKPAPDLAMLFEARGSEFPEDFEDPSDSESDR